jgi:signal transduction histidine kinase
MNRVVEELLLLSRLAHPDDRPNLETLDLRAVVRRTANAAGPEAAARSLALSAQVPVRQVRVLANRDELSRMLAELIENALRYTAPGGTIVVRLERHGGTASLAVADNGVGIPDDERPHVLADFFRGAAARGIAPTGAGLGMSIVDRIVRRHGGTVEVESQLGSGTLVRVTLPVAEA